MPPPEYLAFDSHMFINPFSSKNVHSAVTIPDSGVNLVTVFFF